MCVRHATLNERTREYEERSDRQSEGASFLVAVHSWCGGNHELSGARTPGSTRAAGKQGPAGRPSRSGNNAGMLELLNRALRSDSAAGNLCFLIAICALILMLDTCAS